MLELTTLESKVMKMLLSDGDEVLAGLRRQFAACKVVNREATGAGFFTTFHVPSTMARVAGGKSFKFGDVNATVVGLQHGAGFVLYVNEGILEMLEGYSYDEPWPNEVTSFELTYNKGSRDWGELKRLWS